MKRKLMIVSLMTLALLVVFVGLQILQGKSLENRVTDLIGKTDFALDTTNIGLDPDDNSSTTTLTDRDFDMPNPNLEDEEDWADQSVNRNSEEPSGVSQFSRPDPRERTPVPPERIRDPAEILPRNQDPKALRSDKLAAAGMGPMIACTMEAGYSLEEMKEYSDAIIIGDVVEIVATDYPERYLNSDSENTQDENERRVNELTDTYIWRTAFYRIDVVEVRKGDPDIPFILGREDTTFYSSHCMREISTGDRILLYAYKAPQPELTTNLVPSFYRIFGSNLGIAIVRSVS